MQQAQKEAAAALADKEVQPPGNGGVPVRSLVAWVAPSCQRAHPSKHFIPSHMFCTKWYEHASEVQTFVFIAPLYLEGEDSAMRKVIGA